jgi:methionyl-tRNA formyltransferase
VYTQPDRPAGRGQKLTPSPVKQLAEKMGLPIYQPASLKFASEQAIIRDFNADLMVVVAYGLILPVEVLNAPKYGCINIHASLLPRWRGAAPIQRAILAGDQQTGITIMQMDKGLDTGSMLYQVKCDILPADTSESLHDRLAELGSKALLQTLDQLDNLNPQVQDNQFATYATKISKEEAELDWTQTAYELDRKIRAFHPSPIAFTYLENEALRIWEAGVLNTPSDKIPGEILNISPHGIEVATGNGVLELHQLQLPGGKVLTAAQMLNSRSQHFAPGTTLGRRV